MTPSTYWRKQSESTSHGRKSPIPPAEDLIERLSPEPFYQPDYQRSRASLTSQRLPQNETRGLGLLNLNYTHEKTGSFHPDHIYLDQDGGAHIAGRVVHPSTYYDNHNQEHETEVRSRRIRPNTEPNRSKIRTHTRSGSTIDDLASVAIATSPSFANHNAPAFLFHGSPTTFNITRPATSYANGHNYDDFSHERPAKRIKSERLPAAEWLLRSDRSRSNYHTTETTQEEIDLLLNLKFGTHFNPSVQEDDRLSQTPAIPDASLALGESTDARMEDLSLPVAEAKAEAVHTRSQNEAVPAGIEVEKTMEIDKPGKQPIVTSLLDLNIANGDTTMTEAQPQAEPATILNGSQNHDDVQVSQVAINQETHDTVREVITERKRPRRIKPEVQAEVCAACNQLQKESDEDQSTMLWISCNACDRWYHSSCAGFKDKREARSVDKFVCKDCEPEHGATTFVRKSSRVRTAIDYAGLNQGLVKSSAETSMHHYVQPIKDGRITFLPDDFARIRPEILTVEFMEHFDGMKRPFVVPACWNPRFGVDIDEENSYKEKFSSSNDKYQECRFTSDGTLETQFRSGEKIKSVVEGEIRETDVLPEMVQKEVVDCEQDLLDMIMPRDLTVRKVAELYGPDQQVPVIDVKTQETKGVFTLKDWADYYEDLGEKPIRNVISLEVSESRLGRLIRRPKVVRDLDLEDHVWDADSKTAAKKRPVQFYCLMSVADSYTDFHIDFGGSSVYYHILKGTKTFFFIPPEDKYLKKYEDWCNSDTQNDTFLGDLCGGNCTRVDLHEGDTAFIPAGWIHAVWTPEDSLVIGGNFLSRLDYELQLKVANIEKVTKVPQKFRYPFFQKVMWYALLKYLEEDPVPDEVLEDFSVDPGYVFLRANPVWHEFGDLENTFEPGHVFYNARYYPRVELNGLPHLRDYLYRTARIHADLHVPDINKKQIDAVKASIPKGHGDPIKLVKTLAVWYAWKMGSTTVPEWVHDDVGALIEADRLEKLRRAEAFRVPPERVSARRNVTQPLANGTPERAITPPSSVSILFEHEVDSARKPRSASKGSSLRVACEPCRKRRIKCRHKEDVENPNAETPQEARPRSLSSISNEVFQPITSTSPTQGVEATILPETNYADINTSFDIAQAALASLGPQLSDTNGPNGAISSLGSKKSRSKACEECRKSKRRCVHDEYGRVDPAKAAEPTKPRGSGTSKRPVRLSDDFSHTKRPRTADETVITMSDDIDSMIDPALMSAEINTFAIDYNQNSFDPSLMDGQNNHIIPLTEIKKTTGSPTTDVTMTGYPETANVDEHSTSNSVDHQSLVSPVKVETDIDSAIMTEGFTSVSGDHPNFSPLTTLDQNDVGAVGKYDLQQTKDARATQASRHSSRQPKQIDRYMPDDSRSPSKTNAKTVRSKRRASSSATSAHTIISTTKSRRSSSNTSGTTHQVGMMETKRANSREVSLRPVSRGSPGQESEMDADEKLARELQAAENGLRRRTSMRV